MMLEISTSELMVSFGVIVATEYTDALGAFFRITTARKLITIRHTVGTVEPREPALVRYLPNSMPFMLAMDRIQIIAMDIISTSNLLLAKSGRPTM